ncbi:MAG: ankyrin repeat domain-containing protein [Lentisphaeria bacterium]|nr:ankyrin repeat domain-containing protein [Lentisphaeria bacterium]
MLNPSLQKNQTYHGFTLLAHCGGGAFGDVWYCQDLSGKKLALKIVSKNCLGNQWERELKGVRNYRKITEKHPELLPVYYVGEDDDSFFYTMEPADNAGSTAYLPDTLSFRLNNGVFPPEKIPSVVDELFLEIKTIHEEGCAHRDIKPDNILFVKGKPKLADIGLISSLDVTMTQLAGTLDFLPPELRSGDSGSDKINRQKGDFYAFGKVIYCMITGNPPNLFPSIPPEMKNSLIRKQYFHLALQLCHQDSHFRIANVQELSGKLEKIHDVLKHGETALGRLKFFLENIFLYGQTKQIRRNGSKKIFYLIGSIFLLTASVVGWIALFGSKRQATVKKDSAQNSKDTDRERIVEQERELEKENSTAPDGIKKYKFGADRYSFSIPNSWLIIDRSDLFQQLQKEKFFSEPHRLHQWKLRRSIEGIFILKNKKGEDLQSRLVISTIPLTADEVKNTPDQTLKSIVGVDFKSVSVKRYQPYRTFETAIFLIGYMTNGEKATVCLLPRKNHCIQASLFQHNDVVLDSDNSFFVFLETFKEHAVSEYTQEENGRTPLMLALWNRDFVTAEKMLKAGADINETAYGGSTSLHLAVEEKRLDTVNFLLENGANPDLQDCLQRTPLHIAASYEKPEILMALLKKTKQTELKDFRKLTPLCYAVEDSGKEAVQLLLKAGAKTDVIVNQLFKTPLIMSAVVQKDPEILKILIENGIDIQSVNSSGENALHRVLYMMKYNKKSEKMQFAEILINSGINVNQQDENGVTALMYAVNMQNDKLYNLLISKGANVFLKNKKGVSVFNYMQKRKNKKTPEK